MLTKEQLQGLHHASRIFELRGPEGFSECADKFGEGIASACLVTFLRSNFHASTANTENLRKIPSQVKEILENSHLLRNEREQQRRQNILDQVRQQAEEVLNRERTEALAAARQQAEEAVAEPGRFEPVRAEGVRFDVFLQDFLDRRRERNEDEEEERNNDDV